MKYFILLAVILVNICSCQAQKNDIKEDVDNLRYVREMPYIPELSGDSLYWVVVKEGLRAVPYLIDMLDDTTKTEATVANFGGNYTLSDIAYAVISEIIKGLPTLEFAEDTSKPEPRNGQWGYWNYTRRSFENREKFKERVNDWYVKNKGDLIWVEYTRKFRTAPDWKYDRDKHPLGGYYKIKE